MNKVETKKSKNETKFTTTNVCCANPLEEFIEKGLQEGLSFKGELGDLFERAIDFCIEKRFI